VPVDPVCVDRDEAKVWAIPPISRRLIDQVRAGKAGVAELAAGGVTQIGPSPRTAAPTRSIRRRSSSAGTGRPSLYAASVPGVPPSTSP